MRNKLSVLVSLSVILASRCYTQDASTIQTYIETYRDLAVAEMQRTGVPASIKLAQGIHETTAGTSELVLKSNNHFGIKCKSSWTGESVFHDDDARGECFRKYTDPADSYRDHSDFLKNNSRYASLFTLDPLDYEGWAYGLKKAGYATNPKYPQIIIRLIETYNLQDYTMIALGKMPPKEGSVASATVDSSKSNDSDALNEQLYPEEVRSYPSGEFRINDTKVIYAQKGESYFNIAQQYEIPLARLFEFNDLREMEALDRNQLIFLQRKRRTGKGDTHTVKPGETLQYISQVEGIRLEALLNLNFLQESMQPMIGEQLYLRSKAPAMPKLVTTRNTIE